MSAPGSVLVIGSANTDFSVKVNRLPKPGETVLGGAFASAPGGKGANQAVGAARAGADVTFIARIGRDLFGDEVTAALAAEDINLDYLVRDRTNPSGVALIFIDGAGENSIAVAPGSNGKLTRADLASARKAFNSAQVLLLQLEIPMKTVEAAAEMAAEVGLRIVLNPAPAQVLSPDLLRRVSVLTPNETETEFLTGVKPTNERAMARAAAEFLRRGVNHVVITLGPRGAYVAGKQGGYWIPGYKVTAVDTTAAGDIFNGALAAALAQGRPLAKAARFANAAAALSVTRAGAQPSAPTRAQIDQMLTAEQRNGHLSSIPRRRPYRLEA